MEKQNKYELCVVFKPSLLEDELKAEYDKVVELLEKNGATIDKVDNWGKKRLAYEIQKVHEGFYYFFTFLSDGNTPGETEKKLRITESILRFLIIRQEA